MSTSSTDMTIDEATPDTNVTGTERIPISDAGTPKSVTVSNINSYVLSQIAAITNGDSVSVGSDAIYLKKNGSFVPVPASVVANAVIAYAFDKTAAATLAQTDIISIEQSGASATTTVGALATYLATLVQPPSMDFDSLQTLELANFSSLDVMAIGSYQSATSHYEPKRTSIVNVLDYVKHDLTINTTAKEEQMAGLDQFLVVCNVGTEQAPEYQLRLITLNDSKVGAGDVVGPATNTNGNVPTWNGSNSKALNNGLAVVTDVTSSSTDSQLPTAGSVWDLFDTLATASVKKDVYSGGTPAAPTTGNIPAWSSNSSARFGQLSDGYPVRTSVRDRSSAVDTALVTEKAVAQKVKQTVTIVSAKPEAGATGYETGELVYNSGATETGLYLNTGNSSSAVFVFIGPYVAPVSE